MLLSDIFEHLTYGELSQLFIGGNETAGISVESYPAVVSHLNMALLSLYKRFPISVKEIQLQENAAITTYYLQEKYATESGSAEAVKYLLDTPDDLFLGNVLKIERVTSDDEEELGNLPLNDQNVDESLFTPTFNSLKLFEPNDTTILTVHYRSAPERIIAAGLDPSIVEINIPDSLLEPLIYFIASRAHINTPALDGQASSAMVYMQKYEASVQEVEKYGLIEHDQTTNCKLDNNGWA